MTCDSQQGRFAAVQTDRIDDEYEDQDDDDDDANVSDYNEDRDAMLMKCKIN